MVNERPYICEFTTHEEVLVVDGVVDHALCLNDSTLCCLTLEDKSIGAPMVAKHNRKSCSSAIAQVLSQIKAEVERIQRGDPVCSRGVHWSVAQWNPMDCRVTEVGKWEIHELFLHCFGRA